MKIKNIPIISHSHSRILQVPQMYKEYTFVFAVKLHTFQTLLCLVIKVFKMCSTSALKFRSNAATAISQFNFVDSFMERFVNLEFVVHRNDIPVKTGDHFLSRN